MVEIPQYESAEEANAWVQFVMNRAANAQVEHNIGGIMADADSFVKGIRERVKALKAAEQINRARSSGQTDAGIVVPGKPSGH